MSELTEKVLIKSAGWPVFLAAKALHKAGRVRSANWVAPMLRGEVIDGGKTFPCGLHIISASNVENLCPCRDSRGRGLICTHSVALGLEVLTPLPKRLIAPFAEVTEPAFALKTPSPSRIAIPETTEVPTIRFAFEGSLQEIVGTLSFSYSTLGCRNAQAEMQAFQELAKAGFQDRQGQAVLRGEKHILPFFSKTLPMWEEKWNVEVGERFRHITRNHLRLTPRFSLATGTSEDWLDFRLHYTAGEEAVLSADELRKLLAGGQNTIPLRSGKTAVVDASSLEDLEEVLRDCNPQKGRGGWQVPARCAGYLEETMLRWGADLKKESSPSLSWQHGPLFQQLRPYQREGAQWLAMRAVHNQGGLLADEMGLGKTLQALALIETLPGLTLVVCPSSLVWNWCKEAARFCPSLGVIALEGANREQAWKQRGDVRVFITSYALLRRDIERYQTVHFSTVILDEAQHIKNPDSQNAKAATTLQASSRFILTGTPLENSLRDLWSLFQFLLPNYLGTRKDFQERYENPILNGAQGETWNRLLRRIRPFLLRRKKEEILQDLPPKIEQVLEIELSAEQKRLYDQLQEAARRQIDLLREKNQPAARMKALTALLRLRQCCCDPRLLGAPASAESANSGKLGALLELVSEAIDGTHRILIFSQFTSMLDLIESAFNDNGIQFCRLDGSTKNRGEVVERFQSDATIPVFLISLKAGGVGLNLTAADTVIHYDPWWNPSVEAQATDRAHRFGQERVVTSIKLIARNTVEERVLRLQERKRELFHATLDADTAWEALSTEDLASLVEK